MCLILVISIIIFPALFSCATTQQKAASYNSRGITYGQKGEPDQAISDFNKALEIEPKFALAYYDRGRSYYFKKEYDKSWEDIKRAQDLGYKIPAEFLEDLRKASGRQD
jgi:tetratricopeptide (TPR) repeat protein